MEIVPFAVLALVFYLLLIRPQRSRAKALAQVRRDLSVGGRVMTTAGIHATIVEVGDDDTVRLEVSPGVVVQFATAAVVRILEPTPDGDVPTDGPAAE